MPSVPIETPSETEIVLNSIGVPPASRIPRFTCWASSRWFQLHGIVSIHVVATPTSGRARSSSVKPIPFSIARAGARSAPSVSAALWRLAGSDGRSYGFAHTGPAPGPRLRSGITSVSGKRRRSSASHASASSRRAQTITEGPEPESVDAERAARESFADGRRGGARRATR